MPAIISKPMHEKLAYDESITTLDCISEVSFLITFINIRFMIYDSILTEIRFYHPLSSY